MRRLDILVALSWLMAAPLAGAATLRMEVSSAWIENIARASAPNDWRDVWRHEARGSLGALRELRHGLLATLDAAAAAEHVPKYRLADGVSAGGAATLRQKFGLGAFAPAVSVDAGMRFRHSRLGLDDGWTPSAALRLTKRLTRSWRAGIHGDWEQHYARSAIFDTKHHRFFATLAWDITPTLQLSHGNGRLWGSFVGNASGAIWPRARNGDFGQHVGTYYNTVPWARTHLYGPNWVSYLVDGRVSFFWFELSPALGRNTSVPLRYENRISINQVGVRYRQDVWSLSLLHRF